MVIYPEIDLYCASRVEPFGQDSRLVQISYSA